MAELTRLGRYQLKKVLGRGAMGVVYEGLDPALNRRVAVKTILKNAAIDEETAKMYSAQFAREAQAAGRLNHPNIVGVHDFAEEGEIAYLVMEYIQGRELRSFFEAKEKFGIAEAVRIMGELLDALDFAHEAGVIHRDVKPANVMLDAQRRVKLADFGVARIQDSERSAAGTMVGTPAFMSPEQISGGKIDRRTDLFSAGTILYQLLTGEQPFTGAGAWTVAKKIMQDDPPQPSSVVQSVSPVFDAIVDRALAKKQSDRYASAKEFAAALRATVAPAQGSVPPATPAIPAARQKPAAQASEAEVEFWRAIQNSSDAEEFEFYLEQFPEGTYAGLARHKIMRLRSAAVPDASDTARLQAEAEAKRKEAEAKEAAARQARAEAEARARREAAEKAQKEAEERVKREAAERAQREAAEKAQREAAEKAQAAEKARREAAERTRREAETRARVEAELKARKEAEEKARRETQERERQAAALAKLKEKEAARTASDPEATVAIPRPAARPAARAPAPMAAPVEEKKKSMLLPALIGVVVVIAGVAAFFALNRKPAPAPVVEAPVPAPAAPVKSAAPVVDEEKIRRELEERIRRESADKSAAEQAAAMKAAAEKAAQEKQLAAKSAVADKAAAGKAAAEKAAADKAMAEKLAAAKASGEKAALEKATAEKTAADKAAAEKLAAEKAAAEKAAADKAAAEKLAAEKAVTERAAAEKAAAEKQASAGADTLLERFIQRKGQRNVVLVEPARVMGAMRPNEVLYVNDGSCPRGQIKQVIGGNQQIGQPRSFSCISLADDRPTADRPTGLGAGPAVRAVGRETADPELLQKFVQRVGAGKVLETEPPNAPRVMRRGEIVYVNNGQCGPGRIQEVTGGEIINGVERVPRSRRCIPLE